MFSGRLGNLGRNKIVISTGMVIGLWPFQGGEKRLGPATSLYGTVSLSFVIPSEAEGSAVCGPFVETPPFILKQNCHLDRSVAEWRDLRLGCGFSHTLTRGSVGRQGKGSLSHALPLSEYHRRPLCSQKIRNLPVIVCLMHHKIGGLAWLE
jgi:hypothetical protein